MRILCKELALHLDDRFFLALLKLYYVCSFPHLFAIHSSIHPAICLFHLDVRRGWKGTPCRESVCKGRKAWDYMTSPRWGSCPMVSALDARQQEVGDATERGQAVKRLHVKE